MIIVLVLGLVLGLVINISLLSKEQMTQRFIITLFDKFTHEY